MSRSKLARSLSLSVLVVCFASALLGCATDAAEEDGTDEGATVVTPHGDDSPGKVTVVGAPGATNLAAASFDVDNKNQWKPLATEVSPLSIGAHHVVLSTSSPDFKVTSHTAVTVASNKTTTIVAAAISPDLTGAPPTFGLQNPDQNVTISVEGPGPSWMRSGYANGAHAVAVVAPQVGFRFGVDNVDGAVFQVAAGEVKKVAIWDVSQRRRVQIVAPASRDLPDGSCGGGEGQGWSVRTEASANWQKLTLPAGTTLELGIGPWASNASYVLTNNVTKLSERLPMGATGASPAVYKLGRIDVADVQLSSGQTVKGTYQVYAVRTDAQGQPTTDVVTKCALSTGTGLDLPAGKYRVATSYQTVESGTKLDYADVAIP